MVRKHYQPDQTFIAKIQYHICPNHCHVISLTTTMLTLIKENVLGVLAACREEIGTMFGYSAENRGVGITGGVDFVDLDGPIVVLSLKGRFWHQRTTVLDRVAAYIMGRIPEIIDVIVEDEAQLTDEANDMAL